MKQPLLLLMFTSTIAMACGGSTDASGEDPGTTGEDPAPLLAGTKLSEQQVARYLRDAGFPNHAIAPMVCTAKYESSFYTKAKNHNRNGSTDYGLFQINDRIWMDACGVTVSELYDPATNAQCAKMVYDSGGLNSWYGYKKHRGTCNAFQL